MTDKTRYFLRVALVGAGGCLLFAAAGCIFGTSGSPRPSAVVPGQVPGPPDWATCTISLQKVQDSTDYSLAGARQSLQRIRKQTGWRDLHVVQTDQASIVCRGYFNSFSDSKAHVAFLGARELTCRASIFIKNMPVRAMPDLDHKRHNILGVSLCPDLCVNLAMTTWINLCLMKALIGCCTGNWFYPSFLSFSIMSI